MTITYSLNVANTQLAGFAKLLVRWKGSIYKLLYREMLIFCMCYYSLSLVYRYGLTDPQRRVFEKVALYCEAFTKLIPLSFVLGFYVSIVVNRWWKQFSAIPWPDDLLLMIAGYIHGNDERGRIIRRTLARYLLLLQALCFQAISTSVRRRFPTLDHLVEAGLMTKEEKLAYDEVTGTHGKWWLPAAWFTNLTIRARKEGRIKDDILMKQILTEAYRFRSMGGDLFAFDWISIPLVYTQTVTIAVYTYFFATLVARQYLDPAQGYSGYDIDLYVPIFTILEFFFFMGWLKVAEQLINPFGEDDDDFELNWILDRNLVVSMIIVDSMYNKFPRLQRDSYWDESSPTLPYTKSSMGLRNQPYLGSAINLEINSEESEFIPPSLETIMEDEVDPMTQYLTPPNSPSADLMSNLMFNTQDQEMDYRQNQSSSGRRPPSSISQSALNILPDFIGSRITNMILGSSVENVSATTLKPGSVGTEKGSFPNSGLHSLNTSFSLKSPRRRTRKVSISNNINNATLKGSVSSSLFSRDSVEDIVNRISPSPNHARRSIINRSKSGNQDDQRSLVIDLTDGLSLQSQSTISSSTAAGQLPQPRTRPQSVSMDESSYGLNYNYGNNKYPYINYRRDDYGKGDDGTSSLVYESDLMDSDDPISIRNLDSSSNLPPIPPNHLQSSSNYQPVKATNEDNGEDPGLPKETSQQSELEHSEPVYEPTSSQESLSPGSNQSTVTSITQLISKSTND
ncbi:bestrophin-2 [Tetranychus urticae]|nr:bestrophin-2 [Tetranychus urticae]